MSDAESTMEVESQEQPKQEPQDRKPEKPRSPASFSIWPPTQRTRDAVVDRLIETMTTPSPLSNRYGTLSADEASAAARLIEEDAFAAAGGSAASEGNGMQILQVYSKEISRRMMGTVKARNASASAAENGASETGSAAAAGDAAAIPGEDIQTEEIKAESTWSASVLGISSFNIRASLPSSCSY